MRCIHCEVAVIHGQNGYNDGETVICDLHMHLQMHRDPLSPTRPQRRVKIQMPSQDTLPVRDVLQGDLHPLYEELPGSFYQELAGMFSVSAQEGLRIVDPTELSPYFDDHCFQIINDPERATKIDLDALSRQYTW